MSDPARRAPKLTVLLLCWNHEPFLPRAIGALASQTCRDFDVVFLDNVSTDSSPRLAARLLAESGLEYRILDNQRPQSISANLNRMLTAATGELITFVSTDDWLADHYVETMVTTAEANPGVGWLSCLGWLEDGAQSRPVDPASLQRDKPVTQAIIDGDEPFFFVGCCYRREALDAVEGWDEAMTIEDRDLFYRLGKRFAHLALEDRLVHYRIHHGAASANQQFMVDGWERFYAKHAADFGSAGLRAQRAEMYRRAAAVLVDQGSFWNAARTLRHSLALSPFSPATWRTAAYMLRTAAK